MDNFLIDIVSDLHIEQWNNKYSTKYPCGKINNLPYNFEDKKGSILIVAGDTSDDIDLTLEYLNNISSKYEKILFIDGNHEHVNKYPNLYTVEEINGKVISLNNHKLIYLPNNNYIYKNTLFIGVCGWWNYNDKNDINKNLNYFDNWIPHFTEKDNLNFIDNVIKRCKNETKYIKDTLFKYKDYDNIKNIIIITHTLPINIFSTINDKYLNLGTDINSELNILQLQKINNKISHYIFGHTHQKHNENLNNIKIICNPRGRPEDYDRKKYNLETIEIINN